MNVLGVEFTPDVRAWDNAQRRVGSLIAIGAAALLVLVGLVTYAFARESAAILYWVLVGLVALVLAYEVVVLVFGLRAEREPGAASAAAAMTAAPAPLEPTAVAAADEDSMYAPAGSSAGRDQGHDHEDLDTITLRCGDCGTVFDLTDTGERPIYHTCPGCGAEGVLRDAPAPAAAPAVPATPRSVPVEPTPAPAPPPAAQESEGASRWGPPGGGAGADEDAPAFEPPAATGAPTAAAVAKPAAKRLKLRCGGCKEVFSLDDTGVRPLESRCPHCSRKGVIR